MKNSKINILMVVCLICGMAFTGCKKEAGYSSEDKKIHVDDSQSSDDHKSTMDKENQENKIPQQTKLLSDSLKTLKEDISSLNARLDQTEATVEDLKKQISSKDEIKGVDILAIGLAVLGLLSALLAIFWCVRLKEKSQEHTYDIGKCKSSISNFTREKSVGRPVSYSTSGNAELERRIARIEASLREVYKNNSSLKEENEKGKNIKNLSTSAVKKEIKAFFGNPIQGRNESYFRKQLESRDSDVRFAAIIQGDTASFEPLMDSDAAKKTILSSDNMQCAIDFIGSGSSVDKIVPGKAKKDSEKWVISSKATVYLK